MTFAGVEGGRDLQTCSVHVAERVRRFLCRIQESFLRLCQ